MSFFCKLQEAFAIGWLTGRRDRSAGEISAAAKVNPDALTHFFEGKRQLGLGLEPVGEWSITDARRRFVTIRANKHGRPLGGYDPTTRRLSWGIGSRALT